MIEVKKKGRVFTYSETGWATAWGLVFLVGVSLGFVIGKFL